jgi:hypothetical protein
MKLSLLFVAVIVFCFLGCHKTNEPFIANSFSGALDSCVLYIKPNTFSSDSGVYSGDEYQIFKFAYDDQHRVSKMIGLKLGINVSDLNYSFYYNGSDQNPYMAKDSTFSDLLNQTYVGKHKLYYGNSGRLVLDSFTSYYYNTNGTINTSSISLDVRNYNYISNYMVHTSTKYNYDNNRDTVYLNNSGDESRKIYYSLSGSQGHNYDSFEYYTAESPFSKLNISKVLFGIVSFWWAGLPNGSIDLAQPKYLFKKVTGYYYTGIQTWEKFFCKTNCYYETDASNRVYRITMISYENNAGAPPFRSKVASIGFFYHQ